MDLTESVQDPIAQFSLMLDTSAPLQVCRKAFAEHVLINKAEQVKLHTVEGSQVQCCGNRTAQMYFSDDRVPISATFAVTHCTKNILAAAPS